MTILVVVTVLTVILICIQCRPFEGIWNLDPTFNKTCISTAVQSAITKALGGECLRCSLIRTLADEVKEYR